MITAGVDIGSATSKVVLLRGDKVLSYSLIATGAQSAKSACRALHDAVQSSRLDRDEIAYVVATGYGRVIVPFAQETVTELTCHARGANWLFPSARTILDMGGQDCKAIRCDEEGRLENFATNDKCAAGSGLFLESMATLLEVPVAEMGAMALEAVAVEEVSSRCAVFAESEVISHIHRGVATKQILAGLHRAVADRILDLVSRVTVAPEVVVTGGVARNPAVVKELEVRLGYPVWLPPEPQVVGALGAALVARDRWGG